MKKRLPFLPPPPRDFVTWQTKAFIVCVPTKMTEAEWREFLKYLKHIVRPCVQKEAP